MWSSECSIERGAGHRPVSIFRAPYEKWDIDEILGVRKGSKVSHGLGGLWWQEASGLESLCGDKWRGSLVGCIFRC